MVQVIQAAERSPKRSQQFAEAFSTGIGRALDTYSELQKEKEEYEKTNKFAKSLGLDEEIPRDKDLQKIILSEGMRRDQKFAQNIMSQEEDQKNYNFLKENFGDKVADLYKASPEGGKTHLVKSLLESSARGENFADRFEQRDEPLSDEDKGLTGAERAKRESQRYQYNLKKYEETQNKLRGYDDVDTRLSILDELSPHITPFDVANAFIGGDNTLFFPAASSPEAQRFSKTVNDFMSSIKDTYGARITNFDAKQFISRLPQLINSEEGRRQIIEQMKILNDINKAYDESLRDAYDDAGGLRKIDYDKATKIAKKYSEPRIKDLRKRFVKIESLSKKIKANKKTISSPKENEPQIVTVIGPDGQMYETEVENVELLPEGYRIQ